MKRILITRPQSQANGFAARFLPQSQLPVADRGKKAGKDEKN